MFSNKTNAPAGWAYYVGVPAGDLSVMCKRIIKRILLIIAFTIAFLSPCCTFEIPWGTWKGIVDVTFKGICVDIQSGSPIENFSVEIYHRNIEVQTKEGNYTFFIRKGTVNGKKYWKNFKIIKTLGPRSESLIITVTSKGYNKKQITIPENKILIGQDTIIDIFLEK